MKVILSTEDEKKVKIYVLGSNVNIGKVKDLWSLDWECERASFDLFSGTDVLADNTVLSSLRPSCPGIVEILVDIKVLLPMRLSYRPGSLKVISTAMCNRVKKLFRVARNSFGIAREHPLRFRNQEKVLLEDKTLRENGVQVTSGLDVEFGFPALIKCPGKADENVNLFQTELTKMVNCSKHRILHGLPPEYLLNIIPNLKASPARLVIEKRARTTTEPEPDNEDAVREESSGQACAPKRMRLEHENGEQPSDPDFTHVEAVRLFFLKTFQGECCETLLLVLMGVSAVNI